MNCGHGTAANILCVADAKSIVTCYAAAPAKPGAELFWDYHATTTDGDDELLSVVCSCKGQMCKVRANGESYVLRACPGHIIERCT